MKSIPHDIIGKRMEAVLIRESNDGGMPKAQLHLCFDDGTSMAFWSDSTIHPSGGLDRGSAEDIERNAKRGTETVSAVFAPEAASSTEPLPLTEPLRLISALLKVQNEVIYVLEELTENRTAEARRGLGDVHEALVSEAVPAYICEPISQACGEARKRLILGGDQNREGSAALLSTHRKRLANEIAFRIGEKLPYTEHYFPLYTPTGDSFISR